jgi:hypothetical protein
MAVGDKGLAACVDASASIDEVVTVEAMNSTTVKPSASNGWDNAKSTVTKSDATYTIVATSMDLNDDGKVAWLGVRSQNNQLLKCFASDKSKSNIPMDTDQMDVSAWATAEGMSFNLKYMSFSKTIAIGWLVGLTTYLYI